MTFGPGNRVRSRDATKQPSSERRTARKMDSLYGGRPLDNFPFDRTIHGAKAGAHFPIRIAARHNSSAAAHSNAPLVTIMIEQIFDYDKDRWTGLDTLTTRGIDRALEPWKRVPSGCYVAASAQQFIDGRQALIKSESHSHIVVCLDRVANTFGLHCIKIGMQHKLMLNHSYCWSVLG
ncbi:Aldo/keto reductase [Anopheles sinensis]|uniref:Aldo/keto reductase n=1 Tax=Anopheles sinensis TaxID=74873 RepID=A0A084WGY5_ANOSI|nr:Aldo/keto reductase [Anopheles sinensis]